MTPTGPLERFVAALEAAGCGPRKTRDGYTARCPGHEDREASLSVRESKGGGGLALKCFAGCERGRILAGAGLAWEELYPKRREEGASNPRRKRSTAQQPTTAVAGLTLAAYAKAKGLPEAFLRGLGLEDARYYTPPAVRIPYRDPNGQEVATRYRLRLEKGTEADLRFRWKRGSRTLPYGLDRLAQACEAGRVALVEGESDAQTLWHQGEPALGIPGAATWKLAWADYLAGIPKVYAVVEPGDAGEKFAADLGATEALRERLHLVRLGEAKDPSGLYLRDRQGFDAAWSAALAEATPWREVASAAAAEQKAAAWGRCRELAEAPRILEPFGRDLACMGIVGEKRGTRLVFLAVVSRLLERLVSIVCKGPSSAGKSYIVERVLRFFPPSAYYQLSGMSERFLLYDPEPLAHRMVYVPEATGLEGEMASYLVRTLLSEGRLVWGTVDKTDTGALAGRRVEKEGPTGVILTTTRILLHPENETRLLSVPVDDTREQTGRVLAALANGHDPAPDLARWHALSDWLEAGERRVAIPFAQELSENVPPVAVRLRRDFGAVLSLIRAHALLHRATRGRDAEGRIVATLGDYAEVRDLVGDLIGEAVQTAVPKTVRETVEAVRGLLGNSEHVTVTQLAERLELDKAAASRRQRAAVVAGYLRNLEERRGRPARLVLGEPLPAEREVLPAPELLSGCGSNRGDGDPPSPLAAAPEALALRGRVPALAEGSELWIEWQERAAVIEADGLARDDAEIEAARQLGLLLADGAAEPPP